MAARAEKRAVRVGEETLWDEVTTLKRDRILKEAAALFSERGYHGTTIDDIAERFGATKPFVYYHFNSKIDLLVELCERGTREALNAAERAISVEGSPKQRLDQFVRDFTAVALDNQQFVTIYFREEINLPELDAARINKMRKEIDHKLTKLLEDGVQSGDFKVDDPQMCCLVIAGMISYAFAWYRREGRLQLPEICDQMSRLVLNMVSKTG
jgi:TetR/AcrR family transcriptional regulator, cholesterol catabolism regulator